MASFLRASLWRRGEIDRRGSLRSLIYGIRSFSGTRGCSSVGRAPEWHSGGRRFDSAQLHSVLCDHGAGANSFGFAQGKRGVAGWRGRRMILQVSTTVWRPPVASVMHQTSLTLTPNGVISGSGRVLGFALGTGKEWIPARTERAPTVKQARVPLATDSRGTASPNRGVAGRLGRRRAPSPKAGLASVRSRRKAQDIGEETPE